MKWESTNWKGRQTYGLIIPRISLFASHIIMIIKNDRHSFASWNIVGFERKHVFPNQWKLIKLHQQEKVQKSKPQRHTIHENSNCFPNNSVVGSKIKRDICA